MTHDWSGYLARMMPEATQKAIADAAGVDQTTISRWQHGETPKADAAVRFARARKANPLEALFAAGYLAAEDVGAEVVILIPAEMTDDQLLDQLRARLERTNSVQGKVVRPRTPRRQATNPKPQRGPRQ